MRASASAALDEMLLCAMQKHSGVQRLCYPSAAMKIFIAFLFAFGASVASAQNPANCPAPSSEPENHALTVQRLKEYYNSGTYGEQIRQAANGARDYLEAHLRTMEKGEKPAMVLDIDETALSSWQEMSDCGFCAYPLQKRNDHEPAIVPVLELYRYARSRNVAVFFLTGRKETQRDVTTRNLKEAGFESWADLIMRPRDDNRPARELKPESRKQIEQNGYRIVLNVGDQASDLAGCCALKAVKLPNPFYLVQ
jgi:predicted secreted acid phosphatase